MKTQTHTTYEFDAEEVGRILLDRAVGTPAKDEDYVVIMLYGTHPDDLNGDDFGSPRRVLTGVKIVSKGDEDR